MVGVPLSKPDSGLVHRFTRTTVVAAGQNVRSREEINAFIVAYAADNASDTSTRLR